jgi:hypothetical protein
MPANGSTLVLHGRIFKKVRRILALGSVALGSVASAWIIIRFQALVGDIRRQGHWELCRLAIPELFMWELRSIKVPPPRSS